MVMPEVIVVQLLVSGLWGILYYREMHWRNALAWGVAAMWTTVFMILLAQEKAA